MKCKDIRICSKPENIKLTWRINLKVINTENLIFRAQFHILKRYDKKWNTKLGFYVILSLYIYIHVYVCVYL